VLGHAGREANEMADRVTQNRDLCNQSEVDIDSMKLAGQEVNVVIVYGGMNTLERYK